MTDETVVRTGAAPADLPLPRAESPADGRAVTAAPAAPDTDGRANAAPAADRDTAGIRSAEGRPPGDGTPGGRRTGAVFAVVSAAVFMANLDLFVVNVAFPDIRRDIGGDVSTLSWVLNAYAIVFAALLIQAGRLADRHGRRGGFLLGTGLFTLASVVCAASTSVWLLIAARVAQAAGAALLMPTSLALLLAANPPAARPRAVRAWSAVGGLAAALGPVFGGLLVEADWRLVFLLNVPVGLAALVGGIRVLPKLVEPRSGSLPDAVGTVLLTLGIGILSLGLVKAPDWGWSSGAVVGCLVGTPVLLALFTVRSARHPTPVVELSLLRAPGYSAAVLASLLFSIAFAAMLLSLVMWMDEGWGWSALTIGLAIAPGPLMVPPIALRVAGPLAARIGPGRAAAAGCALLAGGTAWWVGAVGLHAWYAVDVLPGMILTGLGVGLALPTLVAGATAALPADRFATGGAVVTMARQIGSVLGVAILIAVLGSPGSPAALLDAFRAGWWFIAATALAAGIVALAMRRPNRRPVGSR
jgi:EmrB/QacA subfamily drug resistance transporter